VTPTADQYEAFIEWEYEPGLDFFRLLTAGRTSNVLVAPERQQQFEQFLNENKIIYSIDIEDYEEVLEDERIKIEERRKVSRGFDGRFGNFSVYWTNEEIEAWCTHIAATYPQFVQMETLVFSPENRRIYALKVSTGTFGQKPIYTVEAGMHAREWVGPPTALYLLHRIVEDPVTRNELLSRVDWLIIPMQNPDG
jgi:carboxypeptidase B